MQEEIDEFFKKIFFTIENFQKKDLLGKKKAFSMKKRPIFGSILKKSLLTDQVMEKKTDL